MKLLVIIASTRPGRLGGQIGDWAANFAKQNSKFEVEVADLAEINLPMLDAPMPPSMAGGKYTNEHNTAWSKIVKSADAFLVVTPEYNYSMPPSFANAIDYLHKEWAYKPMGFVGYGVLGGARAMQVERQLVSNLNVMPVNKWVELVGVFSPMVTKFEATEQHEKDLATTLDEVHKWAEALLPLHKEA